MPRTNNATKLFQFILTEILTKHKLSQKFSDRERSIFRSKKSLSFWDSH